MLIQLHEKQTQPYIFRPPISVMAFASGKGGVGKTTSAVNIAVALGQMQQSVMLVDTDLGLGNVDVALGINARFGLNKVLDGSMQLGEVITKGPHGIKIVPAASGLSELSSLYPEQRARLIRTFSDYPENIDHLIVDIPAGIGKGALEFSAACRDIVVVVCDEPTSITDAYALIKVLTKEKQVNRIQILANMVESESHGEILYKKLVQLCLRFLDVNLVYFGSLPEDPFLKQSVRQQSSVMEAYPQSPYARAIRKLASKLNQRSQEQVLSPGLGFFFERFL